MTLTERPRVDNSAARMTAEIKHLALRATLWPRQSKVSKVKFNNETGVATIETFFYH